MSQYKVLQNIEAEDKLLGPLSLRQFIYAVIVVVLGFLGFTLAKVQILLVIPLLPPMAFFALLAAPFGHEQSSELWLLAKIRFFVLSRKRVWDQEGYQELVKITAPKVVEKQYTDGLSKTEVKSRLKALSATMDSRGWVIKNVVPTNPYSGARDANSDRLFSLQANTDAAPGVAVRPTDDILDTNTNPVAQSMETIMTTSEQARRQALLQKMQMLAQQQKTDLQQPEQTANAPLPAMPQAPSRTPQLSKPAMQTPKTPAVQQAQAAMTQGANPDILKPDVKQPSTPVKPTREAPDSQKGPDGEVVVSLH